MVGGEKVFGSVQELLAAGPVATFEPEHGLVVHALKCPATKGFALREVADSVDELSTGTLLGAGFRWLSESDVEGEENDGEEDEELVPGGVEERTEAFDEALSVRGVEVRADKGDGAILLSRRLNEAEVDISVVRCREMAVGNV